MAHDHGNLNIMLTEQKQVAKAVRELSKETQEGKNKKMSFFLNFNFNFCRYHTIHQVLKNFAPFCFPCISVSC